MECLQIWFPRIKTLEFLVGPLQSLHFFPYTRPSSAASSEQGTGGLTDKIKEKEQILFHNWYKSLMKEI